RANRADKYAKHADLDHAPRQRPADADPSYFRSSNHGQQYEHKNREQVLDHEPSDSDMAGWRVKLVVVNQNSQENTRARYRDRQPKDETGGPMPTEGPSDKPSQECRKQALPNRAGN